MIATVRGNSWAKSPCHFLKRRSQVCHKDCLVDEALNSSRSYSSMAFILGSSSPDEEGLTDNEEEAKGDTDEWEPGAEAS